MSKILYSIGDSFVYGHGLKTRWSTLLSEKIDRIDINNSLVGASNDRTFRTVIRDICRIEKYGEVWSEETGNVECTLDDILVIIGWTSPFRFEFTITSSIAASVSLVTFNIVVLRSIFGISLNVGKASSEPGTGVDA